MSKQENYDDLFVDKSFPFTIKGKTFELRECGAADSTWVNKHFKGGMATLNPEDEDQAKVLGNLIFRLLVDKYKPIFKSREVEVYNEKTEQNEKRMLTPGEVFMKALGPKDLDGAINAFLGSMGLGHMTEEELLKLGEEAEKKSKAIQKKSSLKTGSKSMTSSAPNMAT